MKISFATNCGALNRRKPQRRHENLLGELLLGFLVGCQARHSYCTHHHLPRGLVSRPFEIHSINLDQDAHSPRMAQLFYTILEVLGSHFCATMYCGIWNTLVSFQTAFLTLGRPCYPCPHPEALSSPVAWATDHTRN